MMAGKYVNAHCDTVRMRGGDYVGRDLRGIVTIICLL